MTTCIGAVDEQFSSLHLKICDTANLWRGLACCYFWSDISPKWGGEGYWNFFLAFFIIGAVFTMIFGWPLLAIIEWKFRRYRLRYVLGGGLCASLPVLIIAATAFIEQMGKSWTKAGFWSAREILLIIPLLLIGLGAGTFYTFIAAAINRKFPLR